MTQQKILSWINLLHFAAEENAEIRSLNCIYSACDWHVTLAHNCMRDIMLRNPTKYQVQRFKYLKVSKHYFDHRFQTVAWVYKFEYLAVTRQIIHETIQAKCSFVFVFVKSNRNFHPRAFGRHFWISSTESNLSLIYAVAMVPSFVLFIG